MINESSSIEIIKSRYRLKMESTKQKNKLIDEYIARFPKDTRATLENIRKIIRKSAPGSSETISYGIPTFNMNGVHLVHFAGFKKHVSLFPTSSPIIHFKKELSEFKTSKGTIQFPLDKPIPYKLIKKIVDYRVKENK